MSQEEKKEQRTPGEFSTIKVSGSFDVNLTQGETNHVELNGDAETIANVLTEVKNGVLTIKVVKGFKKYKTISVNIQCKSPQEVSIFGSGDFHTTQFSADNFKLSTRGSGDSKLYITCSNLELNSSGSGDCTIVGKANSLTLKSFGSGKVHAFDLKTTTITLETKGSGDIDINASEAITGESFGSGDIEHKGTATIAVNNQGSGSITKR